MALTLHEKCPLCWGLPCLVKAPFFCTPIPLQLWSLVLRGLIKATGPVTGARQNRRPCPLILLPSSIHKSCTIASYNENECRMSRWMKGTPPPFIEHFSLQVLLLLKDGEGEKGGHSCHFQRVPVTGPVAHINFVSTERSKVWSSCRDGSPEHIYPFYKYCFQKRAAARTEEHL